MNASNVIMYTPRYNIKYIAKGIPDSIKEKYTNLLNLLNIEPIEANIDYEDWIESIIPIITLLDTDFKKENIFINDKNIKRYIKSNNKFQKLNVISIGIYNTQEEIKEILNAVEEKEIRVIFPDENQDYVESSYSKLNSFKKNSNRKIYGIYAVYDSYLKEYYESILKYKENVLEDNSEEFIKIKKIIENNEVYKDMSIEELKNKILKLEEYKNNSFELKLSELSKEQEEKEKEYFFKTISKFISTKIKIKKDSTKGECISALIQKIDYSYEKLEGSYLGYTVLIQEVAKMENEYRLFVIDNELICGAGCIEYHTPLNNNEEQFDVKTEKKRNNYKIENDRKIRDELIKFGKEVIKEITEEDKQYKNYILDVGMINSKPGIIEINPFKNVGLYAIEYKYILNKLLSLF